MNPVNTGAAPVTGTVTALGVFPGYAEARRAVEALRQAGYRDDQIGVLGPGAADAARERSGLANDPTHTRWEEGTGIGAAAGGLAGLGLGAAVAAGLMSPLGPIVAGGWLVAMLAARRHRGRRRHGRRRAGRAGRAGGRRQVVRERTGSRAGGGHGPRRRRDEGRRDPARPGDRRPGTVRHRRLRHRPSRHPVLKPRGRRRNDAFVGPLRLHSLGTGLPLIVLTPARSTRLSAYRKPGRRSAVATPLTRRSPFSFSSVVSVRPLP